MPKARKRQASPDATPYYDCVSRCVRRAFLCGASHDGSCSVEHRRAWVKETILKGGGQAAPTIQLRFVQTELFGRGSNADVLRQLILA